MSSAISSGSSVTFSRPTSRAAAACTSSSSTSLSSMKMKLSTPRFSSSAMLTRLSALLFQSTRMRGEVASRCSTRSPWRVSKTSATSASLFLLTQHQQRAVGHLVGESLLQGAETVARESCRRSGCRRRRPRRRSRPTACCPRRRPAPWGRRWSGCSAPRPAAQPKARRERAGERLVVHQVVAGVVGVRRPRGVRTRAFRSTRVTGASPMPVEERLDETTVQDRQAHAAPGVERVEPRQHRHRRGGDQHRDARARRCLLDEAHRAGARPRPVLRGQRTRPPSRSATG